MRGAILTFSHTKVPFARFKKAHTETYKLPITESQTFVYFLPYTEDAFAQLPQKKRDVILHRIAQQMAQDDIGFVYPVRSLLPYMTGNFYIPDGRRIFFAFAGQIIERYCTTNSLSTENVKLYIFENSFSSIGKSVAEFLTMHTKQLALISDDVTAAKQVAEEIFEEYGLNVSISNNEKLLNKADIALLLTPPQNRLLTNGMVIDFSGKYPYPAHKDIRFDTAIGYANLLKYFDAANCRSAEFILLCCGLENEVDLSAALQNIGWNEKT